jgi:hypothetical protein
LGAEVSLIFTCYILAALIATTNYSYREKSDKTATTSFKMVFYATWALPVCFLLTLLLTGGLRSGVKTYLFTLLVKLILWLAGIIGAIVIGVSELFDKSLPKTLKGSDLLKNTDQVL